MNGFLEGFRMALSGLLANKVRSALTMLGIIIGVTAVIALVSVGQGFSGFVTNQFASLGTNVLFVNRNRFIDNALPLTAGDARALQDVLYSSSIQAVAPVRQGEVTAVVGAHSSTTNAFGVTPDYLTMRGYKLAMGRFVSQDDLDGLSRVAVLGYETAQTLFPDEAYPLGEIVRMNGIAFEVAGVLGRKGSTGPFNADDLIMVPLTTAQTRLFQTDSYRGEYVVSSINVQAKSKDLMPAAQADIISALRASHRLQPGQAEDFQVTSQSDLLDTASNISGTLTLFLGAIAGISLVVGGIGIMNIMLVSVTERTREIGLRKALGAGRSDILLQFLIEAVTLSLLGGLIGLCLGALASRLIGPALNVQTVVSAGSAMLAVGFSATVGVLFGLYPAMRAARLHPIVALRYE